MYVGFENTRNLKAKKDSESTKKVNLFFDRGIKTDNLIERGEPETKEFDLDYIPYFNTDVK